ncbi:MAG: PilZ domain-containing protein [Sphingopyxis sp.]
MKMDAPPVPARTDDVALRGTKRDSMFLKAAVACERTGATMDVVVRNISAGGMLVDSPMRLLNGDRLMVGLRHIGDVPGRVVWVEDGRFGVAFDVTIDPQQVRKPVTTRRTAPVEPGAAPRFVAKRGRLPISPI